VCVGRLPHDGSDEYLCAGGGRDYRPLEAGNVHGALRGTGLFCQFPVEAYQPRRTVGVCVVFRELLVSGSDPPETRSPGERLWAYASRNSTVVAAAIFVEVILSTF